MNDIIKSGVAHAIVAVVLQLVICVYLYFVHSFSVEHGLLAGGVAACCGYVLREIAQHEYKGGGPKKVSGFYGLTHHWTLDSIIDVLFPIIATGAVWVLA